MNELSLMCSAGSFVRTHSLKHETPTSACSVSHNRPLPQFPLSSCTPFFFLLGQTNKQWRFLCVLSGRLISSALFAYTLKDSELTHEQVLCSFQRSLGFDLHKLMLMFTFFYSMLLL